MKNFEIELPEKKNLNLDVMNAEIYNYDFTSFSLLEIQEAVSGGITNKIRKTIFSNISQAKLIDKLVNGNREEYIAKFSDYAKEKLSTGEWTLGIRKKTGETYAVIKDTVSGKSQSFVTLDKKVVNNLGNLPELSAIQGQLASISEQIEDLNHLMKRVEQGQYIDRYSGFFTSRQLIIEGLAATSNEVKQELLLGAIKTNNDTISKLMFSIHRDAFDLKSIKIKPKEADRIDKLLQNSLGYLGAAVQLNLIAYTALEEQFSLFATLNNYKAFIEQNLLSINSEGKTVAWMIDNGRPEGAYNVSEISQSITSQIDSLMTDFNLKKIEERRYEQE